ncbi:signal peptidase II [Candidatus Endolissoclinum faulkneri L2]|uniref:Lipoprotein signal peptidase n=1 Tax=Candidatus Endolissoclinum faulkneri L2 TaxID=1193729 RepID=K7ZDN1_9PROT|nr:signal peptidase II [Candidatus Endolissoclinum faulkneri]AFX99676.1 signal peptidase II [Candidatus Endolissoclinum faulkneri L2]
MSKLTCTRIICSIGISALVIAVDQVSKLLIISKLCNFPECIMVFPGINFIQVWNKGVSFGMLSAISDWEVWILISLALLICCFMIAVMMQTTRLSTIVSLSAVIGGGIGNIIDRLLYGAVLDFVDVHYQKWHWPAFNIADCAIVLGVSFLLINSFNIDKSQHENPKKYKSKR